MQKTTREFARNYEEKNNTWNITESFVPANQQTSKPANQRTSVLYCRLSDFMTKVMNYGAKSRPSENSLAVFCTKNQSAEVQQSVGKFSHGLEFSIFLQHIPIVLADWAHKVLWYFGSNISTHFVTVPPYLYGTYIHSS